MIILSISGFHRCPSDQDLTLENEVPLGGITLPSSCFLCPYIDVCTSGVIVPSPLWSRFHWKRVFGLNGMQGIAGHNCCFGFDLR